MIVPGTRIELISMLDPWPLESGTQGTVRGVTNFGDIEVVWDNGSTLTLIPGLDQFKVIGDTEPKQETMRVLHVEPMKPPHIVEIPHTLDEMCRLVEGNIACIYPWKDRVGLVHNDNAIAEGRPMNRYVEGYGIIRGSFFLAGLTRDDFCDLPEDLMMKYKDLFSWPELYVSLPATDIVFIDLSEHDLTEESQ